MARRGIGAGGGMAARCRPWSTRRKTSYWRNAYQTEPYYTPGYTYDDYAPAYALGYNSAARYPAATTWPSSTWPTSGTACKGKSRLSWEQAKSASRAAWDQVERAMPGDIDRDGR